MQSVALFFQRVHSQQKRIESVSLTFFRILVLISKWWLLQLPHTTLQHGDSQEIERLKRRFQSKKTINHYYQFPKKLRDTNLSSGKANTKKAKDSCNSVKEWNMMFLNLFFHFFWFFGVISTNLQYRGSVTRCRVVVFKNAFYREKHISSLKTYRLIDQFSCCDLSKG